MRFAYIRLTPFTTVASHTMGSVTYRVASVSILTGASTVRGRSDVSVRFPPPRSMTLVPICTWSQAHVNAEERGLGETGCDASTVFDCHPLACWVGPTAVNAWLAQTNCCPDVRHATSRRHFAQRARRAMSPRHRRSRGVRTTEAFSVLAHAHHAPWRQIVGIHVVVPMDHPGTSQTCAEAGRAVRQQRCPRCHPTATGTRLLPWWDCDVGPQKVVTLRRCKWHRGQRGSGVCGRDDTAVIGWRARSRACTQPVVVASRAANYSGR